jgi:YHS domain-containing protein
MGEGEDPNCGVMARPIVGARQRQPEHDCACQPARGIPRLDNEFNTTANRFIETIVRPRMQEVLDYFENAELLEAGKDRCVLQFRRAPRIPATTRLEISVCPGDRPEGVVVAYRLDILPALFSVETDDRISFSLEHLDEAHVGGWVHERIMTGVDIYLRLSEAVKRARDNVVTDPVCGLPTTKTAAAAVVNHSGQAFYFCSEECQRKFLKDPARYVSTTG